LIILWVEGCGIGSWAGRLSYTEEPAGCHKGYAIYAKPAERVVKAYFLKIKNQHG
jgi:hypothetical protein